MMDLFFGYLLIIIIFIGANISLFLGDSHYTPKQLLIISIVISILFLIVTELSLLLSFLNIDLITYGGIIFILLAIVVFIEAFFYLKNRNMNYILISCLVLFILTFFLSPNINSLTQYEILFFTLLLFIILVALFILSNLLHYANREYKVILNEFMVLESILIFIIGLTYYSCLTLDYTVFSPFLILTPLYKLLYVLIGIGFLLVVGLFINDFKFKNKY